MWVFLVLISRLCYANKLGHRQTLNRTFDFQLEPNHADILLPNGVVELVSGSDVQTLPLRGALYSGIVKRNGLELGWVRLTLDGARYVVFIRFSSLGTLHSNT